MIGVHGLPIPWWLAISAVASGVTGLGPLMASGQTSDPQMRTILQLYSALHAAVVILALAALVDRRINWLAVLAGAAALLAWLIVGLVDALSTSFGAVEPELASTARTALAASLSLAAMSLFTVNRRRAKVR